MFQIALSSSNKLSLVLPTGRAVEVECSERGLSFILKVLRDEKRGLKEQPGYIRSFPTQHAVDKFMQNKRLEEGQAVAKSLGLDLDKLEITL